MRAIEMNLADILIHITSSYRKKTAIIENEGIVTYEDLRKGIERLAAIYYSIGIRENDRVALILPNSTQFIYSFFALLKINAIVVPLSPECTPYELMGIFNNVSPHAIITLHAFIQKIDRESPELLHNKYIITPEGVAIYRGRKNHGEANSSRKPVEACCANNEHVSGDITATINYTYRGLGFPLGAQLSHDNYLQAIMFYIERTELNQHQNILLVLPSYHVFALMGGILAPLFAGATIVIAKRFIISHILEIIKRYQISTLLAVPTLYRLILDHCRDASAVRSVTRCITGGDVMSSEMHDELVKKIDTEVLQGYGLTECLPVTCNPSGNNKPGSLGPPGRADVKIKIVSDSCGDLGQGEIGEIIISSPTVMLGYYGLDMVTRDVLKGDWLYTGDYGYLDGEGYLHFSGRKKKVVKVGGKLVDTAEVKNVLLSHPEIEDVFLHAKEDRLWGNIIAAEIATHDNAKPTEREIQMFCSRKLSSYKIPKMITCLDRVGV